MTKTTNLLSLMMILMLAICPNCYSQKVIYTYIGSRDHPIASMQVSDKEFGKRYDKNNKWFAKGLSFHDSIHWTIYSYTIPTKSLVVLIDTIVKQPGLDLETYNKTNNKSYWGVYKITIIDGDNTQRYFYFWDDLLPLIQEQITALSLDPMTFEVRDYLQETKHRWRWVTNDNKE